MDGDIYILPNGKMVMVMYKDGKCGGVLDITTTLSELINEEVSND